MVKSVKNLWASEQNNIYIYFFQKDCSTWPTSQVTYICLHLEAYIPFLAPWKIRPWEKAQASQPNTGGIKIRASGLLHFHRYL